MKLKDKIKSYSFWVSLASAVILILKILGNRFGFAVDETMISDFFTAMCSILVLMGIIVPTQNTQKINTSLILSSSSQQIQEQNKNQPSENKDSTNTNEEVKPLEDNLTVISKETQSTESLILDIKEDALVDSKTEIKDDTISQFKQEPIVNQEEIISITKNENIHEESNIFDIKQTFTNLREKFSGNIDEYIFELQEELRKTREGM